MKILDKKRANEPRTPGDLLAGDVFIFTNANYPSFSRPILNNRDLYLFIESIRTNRRGNMCSATDLPHIYVSIRHVRPSDRRGWKVPRIDCELAVKGEL